jgi:4-hydroxybenzoate polyprenyltransferase
MLIRPQAGWLNKVPLSILLVALLLASQPLTFAGFRSLVLVVVVVSCIANYGYGLNELFDQEEDVRGGRANVAVQRGAKRVWVATGASALVAITLASWGAGVPGLVITALALLLPATYSIPPIRTKERRWLAVLSDATAAHVYPAALAVLVLMHQGVWYHQAIAVVVALFWAAAAGLRGILSHLIWSAEHDRSVGLDTVANLPRVVRRLSLLVLVVLLPLEVVSFGLLLFLVHPGWLFAAGVVIYLANEIRRMSSSKGRRAFSRSYQGRVFEPVTSWYVPFVDEIFYKTWGPVLVPISAAWATGSPAYLALAAVYVVLFWRRFLKLSLKQHGRQQKSKRKQPLPARLR